MTTINFNNSTYGMNEKGEMQLEVQADSHEEAMKIKAELDHVMKKNIFPPNKNEDSKSHHIMVKIFQWFVIKGNSFLQETSPRFRRWKRIHHLVKDTFMYPVLKTIQRVIGKHTIKSLDEIPLEPWNNHLRIWYWNWGEAVKDIWRTWIVKQFDDKPRTVFNYTPSEYLKLAMESRSYNTRIFIRDIMMTMALEDTADRFFFNDFMLRNVHTLMQLYNVSEEERRKIPNHQTYKHYTSKQCNDPQYFLSFMKQPVWMPKSYYDLKQKEKQTEFTIHQLMKDLEDYREHIEIKGEVEIKNEQKNKQNKKVSKRKTSRKNPKKV